MARGTGMMKLGCKIGFILGSLNPVVAVTVIGGAAMAYGGYKLMEKIEEKSEKNKAKQK